MVIGITGQKGSGKTTIAKHLAKEYKFNRLNFKDALIGELKEKFPDLLKEILDRQFGGKEIDELFEVKPPLVRTLMQNYGTEVRRNDDMNYWVKRWAKQADDLAGNIVVDDVRFINEAEAVQKKDGVIIRVVRMDLDDDDDHQSETEQIQIRPDFTVYTRGGEIDKLNADIDKIISDIKSNVD